MIDRMSGRVHCSQRSSINSEELPIFDVDFAVFRVTLVDRRLGTDLQQVRKTIDMITVPVRDERFVHCGILLRQ